MTPRDLPFDARIAKSEPTRVIAYRFDPVSLFRHGPFVIDPYRFSFFRTDGILMGSLLAILASNGRSRGVIGKAPSLLGVMLFLFFEILLFVGETDECYRRGGFVLSNLLCLSMVAFGA